MADPRAERQEVRDFVVALFERWRETQDGAIRGDGIAEFARQAQVPDGSLRIWLGRAGPKKREALGVPSAVYLLRLLKTAADSRDTAETLPAGAQAATLAMPEQDGAADQKAAFAALLHEIADELHSLRHELEQRLPATESSPRERRDARESPRAPRET